MTVEDRLREALRTEAEQVEPDPQAWAKVQSRVRRRRATRAVTGSLLGAAALVAVVVGIASLLGDDDSQRVQVVPPAAVGPTSTTATTVPVTTVTTTDAPATTTTTVPPVEGPEVFPGVWPFTSPEAVDDYVAEPGVGMFFDAEATALEFAREYLGLPDPTATGDPVVVDDVSVVTVAAKPGSPMTTAITVKRFGGADGPYSVTEAHTENIQVTQPTLLQVVGTDIALAGTSTAFEANVTVEVRQDGQVAGEYLNQSYVMGGANGEMGPFTGSISVGTPTESMGAMVFTTLSAEDGSVQEATVVRIGFESR